MFNTIQSCLPSCFACFQKKNPTSLGDQQNKEEKSPLNANQPLGDIRPVNIYSSFNDLNNKQIKNNINNIGNQIEIASNDKDEKEAISYIKNLLVDASILDTNIILEDIVIDHKDFKNFNEEDLNKILDSLRKKLNEGFYKIDEKKWKTFKNLVFKNFDQILTIQNVNLLKNQKESAIQEIFFQMKNQKQPAIELETKKNNQNSRSFNDNNPDQMMLFNK